MPGCQPKFFIGKEDQARQALDAYGVKELKKFEFQNDCLKMLMAIVCKLQERCPLKYSFLRSLKSLDPTIMSTKLKCNLVQYTLHYNYMCLFDQMICLFKFIYVGVCIFKFIYVGVCICVVCKF